MRKIQKRLRAQLDNKFRDQFEDTRRDLFRVEFIMFYQLKNQILDELSEYNK